MNQEEQVVKESPPQEPAAAAGPFSPDVLEIAEALQAVRNINPEILKGARRTVELMQEAAAEDEEPEPAKVSFAAAAGLLSGVSKVYRDEMPNRAAGPFTPDVQEIAEVLQSFRNADPDIFTPKTKGKEEFPEEEEIAALVKEREEDEPDPHLQGIEKVFKNLSGRELLLIDFFDAAMFGFNEGAPKGYRNPRDWFWAIVSDVTRAEETPEHQYLRGARDAFNVVMQYM